MDLDELVRNLVMAVRGGAGKAETVEEPKEETVEEPKEETVEEPKEETVEELKEETVEEPKEETVEEPKEETVEEPKEETVEEPKEEPKPASEVEVLRAAIKAGIPSELLPLLQGSSTADLSHRVELLTGLTSTVGAPTYGAKISDSQGVTSEEQLASLIFGSL